MMVQTTLTLSEACAYLNISAATGRNWLRLGKLVPTCAHDGKPRFAEDYITAIINEGSNGTGPLRSRRNKSLAGGNRPYLGYLEDSKEQTRLSKAVAMLKLPLSEAKLRAILAGCAIRLYLEQRGEKPPSVDLVTLFRSREMSLGVYDPLISDLLAGSCEDAPSLPAAYTPGCDTLGFVYLSLRGLGERKASGAYYTPFDVARRLAENGVKQIDAVTCKALDPACGTGTILLHLARYMPLGSLYGTDIDEISIQLTRINMSLRFRPCDLTGLYRNFRRADALFCDFKDEFDLVIGNPPWGHRFSQEIKKELGIRYKTGNSKTPESYDIFLERAIELAKPGGAIAYVLPEAFLHVEAHSAARKIALDNTGFLFVSYIGEAFSGVHCPAILLSLRKGGKGVEGCRIDVKAKAFTIYKNRNLSENEFLLAMTDEEYACIREMDSIPHKRVLRESAIFALGIVTGNNHGLISQARSSGMEPILRGTDIFRYRASHSYGYIRFEPDRFQQTAPEKYYRAPEKLIYRFICGCPVFAYDDAQTLTLNSCNIIIPRIAGMRMKYVLAVLNSSAAEFYLRRRFYSVKMLRSHLEQIPIPEISLSDQDSITALVDELIRENGRESRLIYEEIDRLIMNAYELSAKCVQMIHQSVERPVKFLT